MPPPSPLPPPPLSSSSIVAAAKAYMRALKRLKEQLKNWREVCGCGFDPSLLSDVTREVRIGGLECLLGTRE